MYKPACFFKSILYFKPSLINRPYIPSLLNKSFLIQELKYIKNQEIKQIKTELNPNIFLFRTFSDLDTIFQDVANRSTHCLIRIEISNGKIAFNCDPCWRSHYRLKYFINALQILNKYEKLPNCVFLLSLQDAYGGTLNAPIFTFAKKNTTHGILVPDHESLSGHESLRKIIKKAIQLFPWEKKKNQAFWRGASTGGKLLNIDNWQTIPRSQLVLLAKKHPQLNCKFSSMIQCDGDVKNIVKQLGLTSNKEPEKMHLRYKYLIDVDGNTCTYQRLFWGLISNSLLFKQESENIQWFYSELQPFYHYIPVNRDFSDIFEKIEWAEKHPIETQRIIQSANYFAHTTLSYEKTLGYLYKVLIEYANNFMGNTLQK